MKISNDMVGRFLTWPVPADVYPGWRTRQVPGCTGTNLLTAGTSTRDAGACAGLQRARDDARVLRRLPGSAAGMTTCWSAAWMPATWRLQRLRTALRFRPATTTT